MASGQGGFNPPLWQQGSNNGSSNYGPPPAKRSRSGPGPVITYYPPPPGYTGPARPPGWQPTQGWQAPPQQYNYGQQPAYPTPPTQGYAAPSNQGYGMGQYQPPPHRGSYPGAGMPAPGKPAAYYRNYHAASTNFNPPPFHSTQSQYGYGAPQQPLGHMYAQNVPSMVPPPQPTPPLSYTPQAPPLTGPTPPWLQPGASTYNPQERGTFYQPFTNIPLGGNGEPLSPDNGPKYSDPNDIETEYYGAPCPYDKRPDEVDETLSLGTIVNQLARPNRRPLPSTFNEVEIEAIAPRNPRPSDLESMSDYWIDSLADESMQDVRQTDAWQYLQHDSIFREFPAVAKIHISTAKLLADYKDRRDPTWTVDPDRSPSPESDLESTNDDSNMVDSLEQESERQTNGSGADYAQERALARLGIVTGAPKPASTRPGANGASPLDGRKRSRDDGDGSGEEGDGGAENEPGRPSKQPRYNSD